MLIRSSFTVIAFSFFLFSCKHDSKDSKEILKKSYSKCQSIQNGYYEMTRYSKATNGKDTAISSYTCYFEKLKDDDLFSSAFHYRHYSGGQHKYDIVYTGKDFAKIRTEDSTAIVFSKGDKAKKIVEESRILTFYSPLTDRRSWPLPNDSTLIDGKHTFKFIGEELINGVNCNHVQVNEIPVNEKDSPINTLKIEYHFWISESDSIPIQYSEELLGVLRNDTVRQYSKDRLAKYEINNLMDRDKLSLESIPEYYKRVDKFSVKPAIQLTVEQLVKIISLNGDKISMSELKGNFILVDFFFMGCQGCALSFPGLQALHTKYRNKGLKVIGIDPYDKDTYALSRYLKRYGITYPVLLDTEDSRSKFGIQGFPTIFLLDKTGKIIYQHMGGNKNLEKEISQLVLDHDWKD